MTEQQQAATGRWTQVSFLKGPTLETSKMQRSELTPRQAEMEPNQGGSVLELACLPGAGYHTATVAVLHFLI